jgi:predicted NBD/HSP70 family sugar kinase
MAKPLWGIDLGGTKIEGVIMTSLNDPRPIIRTRIDTESEKGYHHILHQIQVLVELMKSQSGMQPEAIGFGTPGILDPKLQTMKNCNSTALNGKPLKKDLEDSLHIPVALANDANCFALAETHWGSVKNNYPSARIVFGIIMGTGVGGGIVMDGKIWNGHHGIAGEWGHNFLDLSGGPCYCGKTGCVETVISGPATEKHYTSLTGKSLKLKEIADQQHTNPAAANTIERLCNFFGQGLSVIVNLLDPDVIVVGGGVGQVEELYTAGLKSLEKFIFNNRVEVPLVKPMLGDSAGVFGAAALVLKD